MSLLSFFLITSSSFACHTCGFETQLCHQPGGQGNTQTLCQTRLLLAIVYIAGVLHAHIIVLLRPYFSQLCSKLYNIQENKQVSNFKKATIPACSFRTHTFLQVATLLQYAVKSNGLFPLRFKLTSYARPDKAWNFCTDSADSILFVQIFLGVAYETCTLADLLTCFIPVSRFGFDELQINTQKASIQGAKSHMLTCLPENMH